MQIEFEVSKAIGQGNKPKLVHYFDNQLQIFLLEGGELSSIIVRPTDDTLTEFTVSNNNPINYEEIINNYSLTNIGGVMVININNINLLNRY